MQTMREKTSADPMLIPVLLRFYASSIRLVWLAVGAFGNGSRRRRTTGHGRSKVPEILAPNRFPLDAGAPVRAPSPAQIATPQTVAPRHGACRHGRARTRDGDNTSVTG
jgi:hypothetical protein